MSNTELRNEILLELSFLKSIVTKIYLCPFIGRTRTQMIGYYVTCVLMLCTITQLSFTLFTDGIKDWLEIINVAPNLGVIIMAFMKYTRIHEYGELYQEIFYHFQDDIWNIVKTESKEHQKIVKSYKWLVKAINRFLVYYTLPLTLIVDSFPYLFMLYEKRMNRVTSEYFYPYDAWYPFDKVKWYAAAYIWESYMTAIVIAVFAISDVIHASFIGFICMELKILGNCLEEILSPDDILKMHKRRYANEIHQIVVRKLKIIIARHNFLAEISSKLNKVLGDAMLLNYSLGAVFICLTAFTFTVIDVTYKRMRYFLMFMSLLIEIFNQCLLGQVLSDHSKNLTEAIYFSDWSNASPEAKKLMLMFMMKTQKPFQLTGNGYIVMNMNSYSSTTDIQVYVQPVNLLLLTSLKDASLRDRIRPRQQLCLNVPLILSDIYICSTSYQFYNLLRTIYQ